MGTGFDGRFNGFNVKRAVSYYKRNGLKSTYYKIFERLDRDISEMGYESFAMSIKPTADELCAQRLRKFFHNYRFSILVPAYDPDPHCFKEMIRSVIMQTYDNWELCIADGSNGDEAGDIVKSFKSSLDKATADKIKYQRLNANRGIAGNSNGALVMAGGDYVGLLDHDDVLSPDALYEIMNALEAGMVRDGNIYRSLYKALYSDEDKVNYTTTRYFDYHRKPGFDIDLLRSNNYICHFFVVRTKIARKAGGFRSAYNGAQDHDFIFRCVEQLEPGEIYHIPKVLYHWRSSKESTAENPDSKLYAYEAGKKAVTDHLDRCGIDAIVTDTPHLGFYRVKYRPSSLSVKTMSPDDFASLKPEDLNEISEDYIMVLSDDLIPLGYDCIDELAGMLSREEVGAAGPKIYDRKGRVESAGYSYDENGELKPDYRGMNGNFTGYLHRASIQHRTDGLSKDCMMIKKKAIAFEEGRPVMKDNYITVYDPFAEYRRK